jgi:hypothetical protein
MQFLFLTFRVFVVDYKVCMRSYLRQEIAGNCLLSYLAIARNTRHKLIRKCVVPCQVPRQRHRRGRALERNRDTHITLRFSTFTSPAFAMPLCFLQVADIGHCALPMDVHRVWVHRLETEFFLQVSTLRPIKAHIHTSTHKCPPPHTHMLEHTSTQTQ